ncbi:MAG: TetR/AcrR family transcriptional regulator [Thermoanaerobaculia bacterium]|nr:TetR/AcrR family transcriptional regulator [Thermoanaerobaculia bacterium]
MATHPTSGPRQRRNPAERRAHLLEIGVELFGECSFDQLSTDQIAERAGISRGLLFHYFGSKRGYYVAVIQEAAARLLERSAAVHDSPAAGDPQRAQLEIFLGFVEENAGLYTLLMRGGVGVDRQIQAIVDESRDILARRAAPWSKAGNDSRGHGVGPERLALVAWTGAVEAAALEWADQRHRRIDTLDRRLLAELLIGMLPSALRSTSTSTLLEETA